MNNKMSGGTFDYNQYHITEIADTIQEHLDRQGKELPDDMTWGGDNHYPIYPDDIQQIFKDTISLLREAAIRVQRIDWFLAADDGEENFKRRLKEELEQDDSV